MTIYRVTFEAVRQSKLADYCNANYSNGNGNSLRHLLGESHDN